MSESNISYDVSYGNSPGSVISDSAIGDSNRIEDSTLFTENGDFSVYSDEFSPIALKTLRMTDAEKHGKYHQIGENGEIENGEVNEINLDQSSESIFCNEEEEESRAMTDSVFTELDVTVNNSILYNFKNDISIIENPIFYYMSDGMKFNEKMKNNEELEKNEEIENNENIDSDVYKSKLNISTTENPYFGIVKNTPSPKKMENGNNDIYDIRNEISIVENPLISSIEKRNNLLNMTEIYDFEKMQTTPTQENPLNSADNSFTKMESENTEFIINLEEKEKLNLDLSAIKSKKDSELILFEEYYCLEESVYTPGNSSKKSSITVKTKKSQFSSKKPRSIENKENNENISILENENLDGYNTDNSSNGENENKYRKNRKDRKEKSTSVKERSSIMESEEDSSVFAIPINAWRKDRKSRNSFNSLEKREIEKEKERENEKRNIDADDNSEISVSDRVKRINSLSLFTDSERISEITGTKLVNIPLKKENNGKNVIDTTENKNENEMIENLINLNDLKRMEEENSVENEMKNNSTETSLYLKFILDNPPIEVSRSSSFNTSNVQGSAVKVKNSFSDFLSTLADRLGLSPKKIETVGTSPVIVHGVITKTHTPGKVPKSDITTELIQSVNKENMNKEMKKNSSNNNSNNNSINNNNSNNSKIYSQMIEKDMINIEIRNNEEEVEEEDDDDDDDSTDDESFWNDKSMVHSVFYFLISCLFH